MTRRTNKDTGGKAIDNLNTLPSLLIESDVKQKWHFANMCRDEDKKQKTTIKKTDVGS